MKKYKVNFDSTSSRTQVERCQIESKPQTQSCKLENKWRAVSILFEILTYRHHKRF